MDSLSQMNEDREEGKERNHRLTSGIHAGQSKMVGHGASQLGAIQTLILCCGMVSSMPFLMPSTSYKCWVHFMC